MTTTIQSILGKHSFVLCKFILNIHNNTLKCDVSAYMFGVRYFLVGFLSNLTTLLLSFNDLTSILIFSWHAKENWVIERVTASMPNQLFRDERPQFPNKGW